MWGAVKPHAAVHRFDCTPHREKKHSTSDPAPQTKWRQMITNQPGEFFFFFLAVIFLF